MVFGFCGSKRWRLRFTPSDIGEQPVACAPKNFTGFASTQPSVTNSRNAFAIIVTQVDVDESPLETVGDLRAEPVDVVVVAVDAHDARPIDRGIENFCRFEIGRNEDASVESLLRGLRGDGVGKISSRGTADGRKIKSARGGESGGHDAVFERKGRE